MNTALTISLYFYLALEILGFIVGITEANKPRPVIDSGGGCVGGFVLLACAAAPVLLFLSGPGFVIGWLAAWLGLSILYDLTQFIRQVHGVRGPRTPASTLFHSAYALINIVVILYILVRG